MMGKALIAIGVSLLFHAGYYSIQYDAYIRLADVTDAVRPPTAVKIELLLAFLISLIGVLIVMGDVRPIRSNEARHSRSLSSVLMSPDFYTFNHRGKALQKRMMVQ